MAARLYPPNIEGTIPAFCGTTIVVPFSLNKAVSKSEIAGFALKIKTVQNSVLLGTLKQLNTDYFDVDSLMQVQFNTSGISFTVGQYYKVQLAFIDADGEIGYYSTVGVVKYTTKPNIELNGLTLGAINNHSYYYTGVYSQSGQDSTEKLYSSRFKVFDSEGTLIKDSGEILHNVADDDNSYEAHEDFTLEQDLESNASFYIQWFITTSNGYEGKTGQYRIMQKKSVSPELKATLNATLNYEDGYIDLYLVGDKNELGTEDVAIGSFVVCRAASNENYIWNKIYEFTLQSQTPSRFLWRDYTIEQGVTYRYSIQQYNDYGLYSDRILSSSILANFEDAFLFDGTKQLKIRYNPKVSSFKTDVLESKIDTIGSKHPIIFRNGNVYYKEFSISGLLSYQMDNNELFMNWSDIIEAPTINITDENLLAERTFKMAVLEWLNNGEPKLFKSPTEGNYIVRLMNSSLSPDDNLGRMLHTFTSTAYEIADFTYDNLNDLGFIVIDNASSIQTRWATVELAGHSTELDEILSHVRKYISAGVTVSITEEQYNRIISYNYDLRNYFGAVTNVSSYGLVDTITATQLTELSQILNSTVTSTKTFSSTEYAKVIAVDENYKTWFTIKTSSTVYTLSQNITEDALTALEAIQGKVTYVTGRINTRPAKSITCLEMLPGTIVRLVTKNASEGDEVNEIMIGATGSYKADFSSEVTSIEIPQTLNEKGIVVYGIQGSITYTYESTAVNVFDTIKNLEIVDIPDRQWIGKPEKEYYLTSGDLATTNDLMEIIEDSKTSVVDVYSLRFHTREVRDVYRNLLAVSSLGSSFYPDELPAGVTMVQLDSTMAIPEVVYVLSEEKHGDNITLYRYVESAYNETAETVYYVPLCPLYWDKECTQEVSVNDIDPWCLYEVCNARFDYTYQALAYEKYYIDANYSHGYYIDKNGTAYEVSTGTYIDGQDWHEYGLYHTASKYTPSLLDTDIDYTVTINGETLDLTENTLYEIKDFNEKLNDLTFGNGIVGDIGYQIRTITYNVEDSDETVKAYKTVYTSFVNKLAALRSLASLDSDFAIQTAGLSVDSGDYKTLAAKYRANKAAYKATLGTTDYNNGNYDFATLENKYLTGIESGYRNFIYQLDLALEIYKEENSL